MQAPMLEALGWTVAGIDLSLGQLRHARAQLPVVAGNGATLPIAGESLDVAVATSSTPTWATRPPSWPRPAGCYGQGVGDVHRARARRRDPAPVGVRHRTLTELLDAVTGAGLQLLQVTEYKMTGPVPGLLGIVGRRRSSRRR